MKPPEPGRPLRFVSAASLFDGHDAAINMIRRLLQSGGAEVVHLGHNRSVADIVRAAIAEDADAIAVSSYQGGHNEYFHYMVDMLREQGASHIRVVVGGGGTISPAEIAELEAYGVTRIYTPEDGRRLGLLGMIEDVFSRVARQRAPGKDGHRTSQPVTGLPRVDDAGAIASAITLLEGGGEADGADADDLRRLLSEAVSNPHTAPVIGLTGTGGAGKSSLNDELLQRFLREFPDRRIAVVAIDPTRRRSGGALLGDRIRMNSLAAPNVFMRSLATRRQHLATSAVLSDVIALYRAVGFDLVVIETAGIGQSDTEIVDLADLSLYVMTAEYGAASQLEKIDMLDFADFVVLNKFEKRGAEDALRDVRKQWRRNHPDRSKLADADVPVFPTIASRFNDPGVNRLFDSLCAALERESGGSGRWVPLKVKPASNPPVDLRARDSLVPSARVRYLAEIAAQGREARHTADRRTAAARRAHGLYLSLQAMADANLPAPFAPAPEQSAGAEIDTLRKSYNRALAEIGADGVAALRDWPGRLQGIQSPEYTYPVRGREVRGSNYSESLSHSQLPKLAPPRLEGWGEILHFLQNENLPGTFPYTGGVYPYRREEEDPTRMFAGEGAPERTNRRFHYLAAGHEATRLSTAFDSTTLYGEDPDTRPDIFGRTGNSGVSIATLDDMKKLYSGFDLCKPSTSVSMTINGPAPMILAMFMNTAIDQRVEKHLREAGRWVEAEAAIARAGLSRPMYRGELPPGHDGSGLGLLGVSSRKLVELGVLAADEYAKWRAEALASVRGTVQADILKEDQAQNTCIFSTEFALRMMGDVQEFFSTNAVRNFYSVSISGYHIAEAGANPITQLAFTLANGFTIVEYYLARGMKIDDFAANLSFFFSNGMDAEYAVIGRVARRIWARAMKDVYKAGPRSQMLKYHIQTSGRSLHAREIQFNDIRTTLQAMYALFDNCNSLHTNAYDEALTTPTEESVRRAVAIQLIINRELGLNKIQNPWQGSFAIETLTDLVEEAVYKEFESIAERGGVLGAMETMYQRGKIQEESLLYETRKHDGSLPIVGVNTFLSEHDAGGEHAAAPLFRASEDEQRAQVQAVKDFQQRHASECAEALRRLQAVAASGGNVFAELLETVQLCSLGQITHALYEVGGQYRRHM